MRESCGSDSSSNNSRSVSFLSEESTKTAQPLESVIEELDQFAKGKLHSESGRSFQLITDGQLHLRQVLHPEACNKGITLPPYFSSFYDLRKEFRKFYRKFHPSIHSIRDMTSHLCLEPDASADAAIRHVQDMANIILRLISDGQSCPAAVAHVPWHPVAHRIPLCLQHLRCMCAVALVQQRLRR